MNKFIMIMLLSLIGMNAYGVVDFSNGNYFQEFIDIKTPHKETELTFKRTYNSVSEYQGLFGKGWGSSFETNLKMVDGAIILTEMGNGRHHIYLLENENIEVALKNTFTKIQQTTHLKDESFKNLKERIILDPQVLSSYSDQKTTPRVGKYRSLNNVFLEMMVSKNEISFSDAQGTKWVIDHKGLIKTWMPLNGEIFQAKYQSGLLDSLSSKSLYIQFKYKNNKINGLQFGSHKAHYELKDNALVKSKDQNGNEYIYHYEAGRLTGLKGPDIDEKITYDFKTGKVKTVSSEGDLTQYSFQEKNRPVNLRSAEVVSKKRGNSKYEYEYKIGREGPYLYRRKIVKQNVVNEVFFDECCGRPIKILSPKGEIKAQYLDNGLPVKLKLTNGEEYSWQYNEKNQISSFAGPNETRNYKYTNSQISKIESSLMGSLELEWDRDFISRAIHTRDNEKKVYQFTRNSQGSELLIDGKMKISLIKAKSGGWELDPKKKTTAKEKMELFVWLKLQEELIAAPKVDEIIGRF